MAEMQGIFQALSRLAPMPSEFLHHANAAISESLDRNVFVSVIYGLVDTAKQELIMARAGHCPAAFVGVDGNATYIRSRGIGLGLDRGPLFSQSLTETTISLHPGDVVVLYTDGVVESRDPAGIEYGYDRLLEVVAANRQEDANDIHDALLADLNSFITESGDYGDDMTLVVLKWRGLGLQPLRPAPDVADTALHT
jgi:serine phosphatase RsbU (regulator of sigma subunit)